MLPTILRGQARLDTTPQKCEPVDANPLQRKRHTAGRPLVDSCYSKDSSQQIYYSRDEYVGELRTVLALNLHHYDHCACSFTVA
jgi:hypothetical protein